jgi:hypothetical protein
MHPSASQQTHEAYFFLANSWLQTESLEEHQVYTSAAARLRKRRNYRTEMGIGILESSSEDWPQEDSSKHFFLFMVFLKLAGSLPPQSIYSRPWKITAYNIYSALSLLWFVPAMIAQIYALHQHWGSISNITDITFELAAALSNSSIGLYLVLNRKKLQLIIVKMQSTFHSYTKHLRFGRKHRFVVSEASRRNAIFSWIVIVTNCSAILIWVIYPFILWCTEINGEEKDTENTNNISGQEKYWKYFCFKMWLPSEATHSPTYQILWTYQAFPIFSLVMIFTGYNLLFFSVTTFTAAHFKMLAMILKDSNKIILLSDSTQYTEQNPTHSKSAIENVLKETVHECQSRKDFSKAVILNYHREDVAIECLHANEELQLKNDVRNDETGSIQLRCDPAEYLIQCIKYHQALLE